MAYFFESDDTKFLTGGTFAEHESPACKVTMRHSSSTVTCRKRPGPIYVNPIDPFTAPSGGIYSCICCLRALFHIFSIVALVLLLVWFLQLLPWFANHLANFYKPGNSEGNNAAGKEKSSQSSQYDALDVADMEAVLGENHALCSKDAYIFRVNTWPPFRGEECFHGPHVILYEDKPHNPKKYWQVKSPGDVEVSLKSSTIIRAVTSRHPPGQPNNQPQSVTIYGVIYNVNYESSQDMLGTFKFTNHDTGQQTYILKNQSKPFRIFRVIFANTKTSDFIHTFGITIHSQLQDLG